jgi:predicted TIM-barrel fold metal-dependent hydrolase
MPYPRPGELKVSSEELAAISAEQRISADSHMIEPVEMWQRLPKALRDRTPDFPGREPDRTHMRAGGWDPHERLKDLAYDNISAEVLYPTLANAAWTCGDQELEEAACRVYNDWLAEFCAVAPERFWGLGMISLWNINNAVQEVERCRKMGLRGTVIGIAPADDLPYGADHYERFWAASSELSMPVNMHIGAGPVRRGFSPTKRSVLMPDGAAGHKWDCMKAAGNIIASGATARYRDLNIVFAEAGVGWIPFFGQEFDYYQTTFGVSASGLGRQQVIPGLPSDYINGQVYGAFISDTVGCSMLRAMGWKHSCSPTTTRTAPAFGQTAEASLLRIWGI